MSVMKNSRETSRYEVEYDFWGLGGHKIIDSKKQCSSEWAFLSNFFNRKKKKVVGRDFLGHMNDGT